MHLVIPGQIKPDEIIKCNGVHYSNINNGYLVIPGQIRIWSHALGNTWATLGLS